MSKRLLAGLAALLAVVVVAAIPVVVQASAVRAKATTRKAVRTAKGAKPTKIVLHSEEKSSLCVNPTEKIFASPGTEGHENFTPLTAAVNQSEFFADEGAACGESHPPVIEGGTAGGPSGFKYNYPPLGPLYHLAIPTATWLSAYPGAKDTSNLPPKYYIYDAEFNLPCLQEGEGAPKLTGGEMAADNAAGVFLNGKFIEHDKFAAWPGAAENFTKATLFSTSTFSFFKLGRNVLQFVVLDQSKEYTALDFKAIVTYGPCKHPIWGPNVGTEKVQTISWGKLTFATPVGPVTCKKSDAGNIWNKEGTGLDETVLFDLYECSTPECPKGVSVTASGLPWPSELEESPVGSKIIRDRTTGIGLAINCENRVTYHYTGELTPKVVNGTSAKPAFEEFDAGSGALHSSEPGVGELKIAGNDNMAGFESLQVITAGIEKPHPCKPCEAAEKLEEKKIKKEEVLIAKRRLKEGPRNEKEEEERFKKEIE